RLKIQVAELDESSDLVSESKLSRHLLEKGQPDEIQSFLSLFPDSRHAGELRQRQQELIASGAGQPPAPTAATKPVASSSPSPAAPPPPAPASETARIGA